MCYHVAPLPLYHVVPFLLFSFSVAFSHPLHAGREFTVHTQLGYSTVKETSHIEKHNFHCMTANICLLPQPQASHAARHARNIARRLTALRLPNERSILHNSCATSTASKSALRKQTFGSQASKRPAWALHGPALGAQQSQQSTVHCTFAERTSLAPWPRKSLRQIDRLTAFSYAVSCQAGLPHHV